MVGNGDERQAAAWERVEAKLDRLSETVAEHGEILAHLVRLAEQTERRLKRLEDEVDLLRLLIEAVRREVDIKLDRLKHELIDALGQQTRVELLAAQTLNDGRLAAIERRLEALEARP